ELRWIHEDRCHDHVGLGTSGAHQRDVSLVQSAHGGDEPHALSSAPGFPREGSHFCCGVDGEHGESLFLKCRSGSEGSLLLGQAQGSLTSFRDFRDKLTAIYSISPPSIPFASGSLPDRPWFPWADGTIPNRKDSCPIPHRS